LVGGGDIPLLMGASLGKEPIFKCSTFSAEMVSQVDDPSDPTAAWLLGSPLCDLAPYSLHTSPAVRVVQPSGATSAGKGLGVMQSSVTFEVMHKSLSMEEMVVVAVAVDLRKEATAAVSLVCGKRTKVLTTETIKAKRAETRVRKSSRLKGRRRPRPLWRRPSDYITYHDSMRWFAIFFSNKHGDPRK
jgi:hypothetical protein